MSHSATIIDWISFTIPCEPMEVRSHEEMYKRVGEAQVLAAPHLDWNILISDDWEKGSGRAPYKECIRSSKLGLSVYWSPTITHILHEFSGKGCENLRKKGMLLPFVEAFGARLTRLDLATDIETDCAPSTFVQAGVSDRIKARGSFVSQTGYTEYVGSAKSEKFARVYRYAAPHPRADLLRIEHVLRRDYARSIAPYIVQYGVTSAQVTVGETMGWMHPLWKHVGENGIGWSAPRNDRKTSGTERWLIGQAAPAFRKLAASGAIEDPFAWLMKHFYNGIVDVRQLPLDLGEVENSLQEER